MEPPVPGPAPDLPAPPADAEPSDASPPKAEPDIFIPGMDVEPPPASPEAAPAPAEPEAQAPPEPITILDTPQPPSPGMGLGQPADEPPPPPPDLPGPDKPLFTEDAFAKGTHPEPRAEDSPEAPPPPEPAPAADPFADVRPPDNPDPEPLTKPPFPVPSEDPEPPPPTPIETEDTPAPAGAFESMPASRMEEDEPPPPPPPEPSDSVPEDEPAPAPPLEPPVPLGDIDAAPEKAPEPSEPPVRTETPDIPSTPGELVGKPLPPPESETSQAAIMAFLRERLEHLEHQLAKARLDASATKEEMERQQETRAEVDAQINSMYEKMRRERWTERIEEERARAQERVQSLETRLDDLQQTLVTLFHGEVAKRESSERSVNETIDRAARKLTDMLEDGLRRIREDITESGAAMRRRQAESDAHIERIARVTGQVPDALVEHDKRGQAQQKGMADWTRRALEAVHKALSGQMARVSQAVQSGSDDAAKSARAMEKAIVQTAQALKSLQGSREVADERVHAAAADLAKKVLEVEGAVKGVGDAAESHEGRRALAAKKLDEKIGAVETAIETINHVLTEHLKGARAANAAVTEELDRIRRNMKSFDTASGNRQKKEADRILAELEGLAVSIAGEQRSLHEENRRERGAALAEMSMGLQEETRRAIQEAITPLREEWGRMGAELEALKKRLTWAAERVEVKSDGDRSVWSQTLKQISDMSQGLVKRQKALEARMEAVQASLDDLKRS